MFLRMRCRRSHWWLWKWHWVRVVAAMGCGGAGLALCWYWTLLTFHTYQEAGDPVQASHLRNFQGSHYARSQGDKSDKVRKAGSVKSNLEYYMSLHEAGTEYQSHHKTFQHMLNQHANDSSHEHFVQNLKPHKIVFRTHQNNLRHNNSLNSGEMNLYHPDTHLKSTNKTFSRREAREPSHSNHQTYSNSRVDEIINKNPPSINMSSGANQESQRDYKTFVTATGGKGLSKVGESKKQGKDPPRVILLLTSWRSGSTFMGELLSTAVPETFYSYEPLHPWKIQMLDQDNTSTRRALALLKDLFQCRMETHAQEVAYMASMHWYLRWNTRLASQCKAPPREKHGEEKQQNAEGRSRASCNNASFVSDVCRGSSLHVAKVVRLSLRWTVPLLEDEHLPLQIVYLVRDPRAVLSSRSRLPWCGAPACRDPFTVCASLQRDLLLLPHLLRRYPNRIKMVLYEEFLQDLPHSLHDLLAFLHLPVAPSHLAFLNASARGETVPPRGFPVRPQVSPKNQGAYGTKRVLKHQAFLWRLKTPYKQAARYQARCKDALKFLRLRQFTSSQEYRDYYLSALLPRPKRPHS